MIKEHIILAMLWAAYCVVHSLLASLRFKAMVRQRLGSGYRYYRLFYTILAFAGLILIVYYQTQMQSMMLFGQSAISLAIGAIIGGAGLAVMLACIKKYFMSLSGLKSLFQENSGGELMISGIHRYVRHPLYTGTFLFIWGLFVVYPKLSICITDTIITVYTLLAIRLEEYKLIAEYGDAYKKYQQMVPKLIPAVGSKRWNWP